MDTVYQRYGNGAESPVFSGAGETINPDGTLYGTGLQYGIRTDVFLFKL